MKSADDDDDDEGHGKGEGDEEGMAGGRGRILLIQCFSVIARNMTFDD